MKEEYLDIVNEKGEPTGETIERNTAHTLGIRHRTSHVWLLRKKEGMIQILLQKRSDNKDSHPGCYDISSAGIGRGAWGEGKTGRTSLLRTAYFYFTS